MAPSQDTDEEVGLLRIGLFFDGTRNNAHNLARGRPQLPQPRPARIEWGAFLDSVAGALPFSLEGEAPKEPAHFDPAQLQQVLINLLKNAHESGSAPEDVRIAIESSPTAWQLRVVDRGCGMSDGDPRHALVPFYSTKPTGTGLGLSIVSGIISSYGGTIDVDSETGRGTTFTIRLPPA